MHAIIRQGNGKYYISAVFGYYDDNESAQISYDKYYIVFDEDKKTLVKQYLFNKEVYPTLDKMVLLLNIDSDDWILNENDYGCVDFLANKNLLEIVESQNIDKKIIAKCKKYDEAFVYSEINEVKNQKDAERLMLVSGYFHDGFIKELEELENGSLRVLFSDIWGCKIELNFSGDVSYSTESRNPNYYDPYWSDSTVLFHDGLITFIDDEYATVENIRDGWCYFTARRMFYRIIPE